MVGFSVEAVFDDGQLAERCNRVFSDAAAALGMAIYDDSEIYVPYDTGALCASASCGTVTATERGYGCDVVWTAPHASAVYYGDARGVRYHTDRHTHARARWFEGARDTYLDAWVSDIRAAVYEEFHA